MKLYAIFRREGWRSPEDLAIRNHAERAGLRVNEIIPVADAVVVRADPQRAAA